MTNNTAVVNGIDLGVHMYNSYIYSVQKTPIECILEVD